MSFFDEQEKVETPALEQLQALGWTSIPGANLSPETSTERQYYRDVVLQDRLTTAIRHINPWISEENLRKVMRDLRFQGLSIPP
jgi:type I restriction enzyme R subunit